MIGKVVTGCVAILPYHTATQDRGSECRDFGFISRIVTALIITAKKQTNKKTPKPDYFGLLVSNSSKKNHLFFFLKQRKKEMHIFIQQ